MPISLKLNTLANYVGLIYTTLLGVLVLPLYMQYLGAEAFGIVGLFVVLQAWMQLVDMGMSPVMSREAARVRGAAEGYTSLKKLLSSFEIILLSFSILIIVLVYLGAGWISSYWLNIESIQQETVENTLIIISVILSLRLYVSLYRNGIQGLERQVWLNVINIFVVTVKFIGALALLYYVTNDVVHFFVYQLVVGFVELIVLYVGLNRFVSVKKAVPFRFYWEEVKAVLPFASAVAYAVVVWVLLTQLDKLVLSKVLSLTEFGYFSLVVIVVSGISQLMSPISQAVLPRMTYLVSKDQEDQMIALYRKATQYMLIILLPLTAVIAVYSWELLYAWTGNKQAAEWASEILMWFSLGSGVLAITAFQYYLQYAFGKLKLHTIYNTVSVVIQVPLVIYVALEYGALGAALVWFLMRIVTFVFWMPYVHYKFVPGLHLKWLVKDVMPIFLATMFYFALVYQAEIDFIEMTRVDILLVLFMIGGFSVLFNGLISREGRNLVFRIIKRNEDYRAD